MLLAVNINEEGSVSFVGKDDSGADRNGTKQQLNSGVLASGGGGLCSHHGPGETVLDGGTVILSC